MYGIIVFQDDNEHPLSWMLKSGFKHVWCATLDPDRGWSSYDWRKGFPAICVQAGADFDLAGHYRNEGYTVLEIECGTIPSYKPFILNNCVGHVKLVTGVKSWALTPHQLYKHLTKEQTPMWSRIKQLMSLPGFGGGSAPAVPATPPPPPEPPKKTDPAVQEARRDEQKRARIRAGQGGTIKTPVTGVGMATTTKTLLGQ
jgi:hypothetical protein